MEHDVLSSAVESILFASDRPVGPERLREVFGGEEGPAIDLIQAALDTLQEKYRETLHGIELRKAQGGYQFVTKVENAEWVRKFQASKPFRVGRSALEVLSIIAYRQPVTRAEIDQVRGIDSSHLLRTLIERGLVKMAGKAEVPGRPVQYGTTPKFLETVGLSTVSELPPLSELEQLQGHTEDPLKKLEEGLERFMEVGSGSREEDSDQAAQNEQGLLEIDTMIAQAEGSATKEVFETPDHAEVYAANQEALAAFLASKKAIRRKKTVTFDELQAAPTESSEMSISSELPPISVENEEAFAAAEPHDEKPPELVN